MVNNIKNKQAVAAASAIISAESKDGADLNLDLDKDLTVHSMPKRFLKTAVGPAKTKGIGIIILAIGAIFLVAALAFAYYYLSGRKTEKVAVIKPEENSAAVKEVKKEKPAAKTPEIGGEEKNSPVKNENKIINKASSTIIKEEPARASSTEKSASSTAKIIQAPVEKTVKEYTTGADKDQDGLSDMEEILFDCNINSPDSDGDGYNDLSEILNLYNPAGGGSLMVNPNIEKYINSEYNYYLYYPYLWQVDNSGGEESIIFKIENNQFIQVITQMNPDKQNLEEWYLAQMEIETMDNDRKMYKKGWQAIKSEDNLTVYLAKPKSDKIFIISYNPGISNVLNYKNIFDMMVKSFEAD